ncbi:unnamed protein product [Linum tenue]|uniref:Uncharacterized protein n=1 Tax=Linum tenue TaxID=586396 RepID=A0AAV0QLT9_9ROSI|nr:unnamed protein product [Linum tenue]
MSLAEESMVEPKRQRRKWWDVGIVSAFEDDVVVDLMGKSRDDTIHRATCKVTAPTDANSNQKFRYGMGFAVLGTKLYAFGGRAGRRIINPEPNYDEVFEYPRSLFVCDLPDDPENHESLECVEHPNKLLGPKRNCIHVPYKDEKLIMLATEYVPVSYGPKECPAPCEVLHLKDLTVENVHAPFWDWDETKRTYPDINGYVVVESLLYVVVSHVFGQWELYSLDMAMDKLEWQHIHRDSGSSALSLLTTVYTQNVFLSPLCSSVVQKDRFFLMKETGPDRNFGIFVKDSEKEVELPELSNIVVNVQGSFYDGSVMVVPFRNDDDNDDERSDMFCFFVWYRAAGIGLIDSFQACKFKLFDNGGCTTAGSSTHRHCEVLPGWPTSFQNQVYGTSFTAFTPESYIVVDPDAEELDSHMIWMKIRDR